MTEQNKGRRLSLVKDNAPGENPLLDRWKKRYGKAYENELLNLKTYINALERDHASKVVDLMQEQEKKRTRIIRQYLAALLATSGLCSIITVYTIKTSIDSESIEIHQLENDLMISSITKALKISSMNREVCIIHLFLANFSKRLCNSRDFGIFR